MIPPIRIWLLTRRAPLTELDGTQKVRMRKAPIRNVMTSVVTTSSGNLVYVGTWVWVCLGLVRVDVRGLSGLVFGVLATEVSSIAG